VYIPSIPQPSEVLGHTTLRQSVPPQPISAKLYTQHGSCDIREGQKDEQAIVSGSMAIPP